MTATFPARLREFFEMIKFSHSLFALPFAFAAMLLAADGLPPPRVLLLIVACMVTARTAAMTFNRIVDRRLDAANPRTRDRALPAGRVSLPLAWGMVAVSAALFVVSAALLNRLTLVLAPVALAIVLGYSLAKRFTSLSHWWLGLGLAVAPVGAWIAVRGSLDPRILLLGLAVLAWTAGFDVLYACQDEAFDRATGLHSAPARFGIAGAFWLSRASHAVAVAALVATGFALDLSPAWFAGTGVVAGILLLSHILVAPTDLSLLPLAFFQCNVAVSLAVFITALAEKGVGVR